MVAYTSFYMLTLKNHQNQDFFFQTYFVVQTAYQFVGKQPHGKVFEQFLVH